MPLPLQHIIHLSSLIIQIFTVAPASFASGNVVYVSSGAAFTAYAFDLSSQAFSVRCSQNRSVTVWKDGSHLGELHQEMGNKQLRGSEDG